MFSRSNRRGKRKWSDVREPETTVPDTTDALQKAAEAVDKSGASLFDMRDLYDCVREAVDDERLLVCPSTEVASDVAAICAMARDVCAKPVAIVGHLGLIDLLYHLSVQGIGVGTCDFGRKTELVDDIDASVAEWDRRELSGVILIVIGTERIVRPSRARIVIRITNHASKCAARSPPIYSPPRLWRIAEETVVHRGSRSEIVAALSVAWADKAWNAEDKVPGRGNPKECPICMEDRADVVLSCCTASYCWSCVKPWVEQRRYYGHGVSCPSCRNTLEYNTFHVVESLDDRDGDEGLDDRNGDEVVTIDD